MAAVRGLVISVKSDSGLEPERSPEREPEPMEVEEGELEPAHRSVKELIPDNSRRYENKAGTFITGIDVTSKEAIEKKEQRAKRFHFRAEVNVGQRNIVLDRDILKKAIPNVRMDTLNISGVDEMSTRDVFAYFKSYPPAHIEWLDDTSCNVVWLDEVTATRALLNMSSMPTEQEKIKNEEIKKPQSSNVKKDKEAESSEDEAEEGEVEEDNLSESEADSEKKPETTLDTLSQVEEDSLLRNDTRFSIKLFKENKLIMRFATRDDKKELGAAKRSQYYMKYGNPNYGGMKGILSNSWKRRYHSRRMQRDVSKKKTFDGEDDDVGLPPFEHRHSGLVKVPEEPIEEEEEDDDDDEDEDMDEDDRVVVEYHDELQAFKQSREHSRARRSSTSTSDSDEMDYDLELKMISTPSPKKTMKMTMYADEVESQLKTIRNSMKADGVSGSNIRHRIGSKATSDVRHLLEEKRHGSSQRLSNSSSSSSTTKSDVRQRLGKRPRSPDISRSPSSSRREPMTDVHSRLGIPKQDGKSLYSEIKEKRTGNSLWNRLGAAAKEKDKIKEKPEVLNASTEEDDSELQQAWGALIKEKEQTRQKKSRLDNLPSLQIEISRESSSGSDSES